jgi:hypothetical protein
LKQLLSSDQARTDRRQRRPHCTWLAIKMENLGMLKNCTTDTILSV